MNARHVLLAGFFLTGIFGFAQGCESKNSLVGGDCVNALLACGEKCVDPSTDRTHCGRCDNSCAAGVSCVSGICGGPDGSLTDSSTDSDADTGTADGGDSGCVPPFDRKDQCGNCFTSCQANQDCLFGDAGTLTCSEACAPPLVGCGGKCISVDSDPLNCGACGKFCVSFICASAKCQGANPGDVAVIGHDFFNGAGGTSQSRILTNAVLVPRSNPLRILSFEKDSNPTAVANVKSILTSAALGRTLQFTRTTNDVDLQSSNDLSRKYDVVFVYDQEGRAPASLGTLGDQAGPALIDYAKQGGVVVVLDGASGQEGMPTFLTRSGLLAVAGHTRLASFAPVSIAAPVDVLAVQVVSPYAAFDHSVSLQGAEANGGSVTWVVRQGATGTGDPVVIHKTVQ